MIDPHCIFLNPEAIIKPGTFGIGFNCSWEQEHGLGIVLKNWQVMDIGSEDTAFKH